MSILSPLANPVFRQMFLAQALSLIGSGMATVALGLLAYQIAGQSAGVVLGTALAVKMIAYVVVSPVAAAIATNLPRRTFLVGLDIVRAIVVLFLPFVDSVWQIYSLIFLIFATTAGFSPVFYATIPDIVREEKEYTKALALSRLAFNVESITSPVLAGLLLIFVSFHWLFVLTSAGFLASAALVGVAALPDRHAGIRPLPFARRMMVGFDIYFKTPRLRALFVLSLAIALVGANVFVNSIIIAHQTLGGDQQTYLNLLLAVGVGSIVAALGFQYLLEKMKVRTLCVAAAFSLAMAPFALLLGVNQTSVLLVWAIVGAGISLITTSSGLLLRSSANENDRPSIFAAQFSLSHASWLVTYPTAAWLGVSVGPVLAMMIMAAGAFVATLAVLAFWPSNDPASLFHEHAAYSHLHDEHHLQAHETGEGEGDHQDFHHHEPLRHAHHFVIDDHHRKWPNKG